MANHVGAARLRAELAKYKTTYPDAFTDGLWRSYQIAREAADSLALITRWSITVIGADRKARYFVLIGLLDHVERRVALIFPRSTVVAIEPAATADVELIDARLTDLGEHK